MCFWTNIYLFKTSKALWDNDIHTLQYGSKVFWQSFIFMELESFFNYFVITKTLNMSHVKYKQAYISQDSKITRYQTLYGRTISILYKTGEKYCGSSSYLWRFSHFSTILWWPRHWIQVMIKGKWCSWAKIIIWKHQIIDGITIYIL